MILDLCTEELFQGDTIILKKNPELKITLPPVTLKVANGLMDCMQKYLANKEDATSLNAAKDWLFTYLNTNNEGLVLTEEYLTNELNMNKNQSDKLLNYFLQAVTGIEKK